MAKIFESVHLAFLSEDFTVQNGSEIPVKIEISQEKTSTVVSVLNGNFCSFSWQWTRSNGFCPTFEVWQKAACVLRPEVQTVSWFTVSVCVCVVLHCCLIQIYYLGIGLPGSDQCCALALKTDQLLSGSTHMFLIGSSNILWKSRSRDDSCGGERPVCASHFRVGPVRFVSLGKFDPWIRWSFSPIPDFRLCGEDNSTNSQSLAFHTTSTDTNAKNGNRGKTGAHRRQMLCVLFVRIAPWN